MKNTGFIKVGIVVGVIVLIMLAVIGNWMKGKGKEETKNTESAEFREKIVTNAEPAPQRTSQRETREESTEDTESYTIQTELPTSFPESEPESEAYDEYGNMQVSIYFTNTAELDRSNLLPLTAWEKLGIQAQKFLDENKISAGEIRVIDDTMVKEGSNVRFDSSFPDIPGSHFIVTYDLNLRKFSFQVQIPPEAESLQVEETGGIEDET